MFFPWEAQQFANPQLTDVSAISKRGSCESVNSRRFFWRRQLKVQVRKRWKCWAQVEVRFSHLVFKQVLWSRWECWAQVEVRFSHLVFKQCCGAGGIPNSHPLPLPPPPPPEVKFSQLVKFLSRDLNLALVEFLKGS